MSIFQDFSRILNVAFRFLKVFCFFAGRKAPSMEAAGERWIKKWIFSTYIRFFSLTFIKTVI